MSRRFAEARVQGPKPQKQLPKTYLPSTHAVLEMTRNTHVGRLDPFGNLESYLSNFLTCQK
jgi:hypothetical protein